MSGEQDAEALSAAWQALWDRYRRPGTPTFFESRPRRPQDPETVYLWGYGALLAAAGALAHHPHGARIVAAQHAALAGGLARYRRPGRLGLASAAGPRGGRGDAFYDDNAWVGLAALELAEREPSWHAVAVETFRFILEGVDPETGGVFWKEQPKASLHVCSTGPALILGRRLRRTGESWISERLLAGMERWLEGMRAPDGRYWDNRKVDGTLDRSFYTYNAGTPIEAMAESEDPEQWRERVAGTLSGLARFLDAQGELPPTPWFNAVLLRALIRVEAIYGLASPFYPRYAEAIARALDAFRSGRTPILALPSRSSTGGIMLRDAAASVEILARLGARAATQASPGTVS